MCGIAGIIDHNQPVSRDLVRQMTDTLTHRGPDEEGFYFEDGVGLGHRRLSIIDLNTGGQPVHNEDKTIWVIFNGEIYNYQSLTDKLKAKGHKFYTNSDTEVIVHLYEDHGEQCLKYLRGMFAFALWDTQKKRLFLARDRVGKKPVAYYHTPGRFVFGSEIKSILCDKSIKRDISLPMINEYLTFGYIPAPDSVYKNIKKLMPGHYLIYENDKISQHSYWNLEFTGNGPAGEKEAVEKIENTLIDAIRLRMIADVPLGAFLSGGVDSSLIVALMSRLSNHPVKTFSIGFHESDFSEIKFARRVAQMYKTEHHEDILSPDIFGVIQTLLEHYDEPFADSSMIPTYLVSKAARRHVTVALTGDGGDEIFAGYNRYTRLAAAQRVDRIPGFRQFASLAAKFPLAGAEAKRKLKIISTHSRKRQLALSSVIDESFRTDAYTDDFRFSLKDLSPSEPDKLYRSKPERLDKWQYSDIKAYLPNDILVKVDRSSMLTSLETRAPLLDHKLIELVASIPEKLRTNKMITKYLLKKIAEKYLPKEILYRPKMGFMIPASHWFRNELKPVVKENLLSDNTLIKKFVKQNMIEKIYKEHQNRTYDHSGAIFTLLYLELWMKRNAPNV